MFLIRWLVQSFKAQNPSLQGVLPFFHGKNMPKILRSCDEIMVVISDLSITSAATSANLWGLGYLGYLGIPGIWPGGTWKTWKMFKNGSRKYVKIRDFHIDFLSFEDLLMSDTRDTRDTRDTPILSLVTRLYIASPDAVMSSAKTREILTILQWVMIYIYIDRYTGWWFGTWFLCFYIYILGIIIPTDELQSFFRGVAQPPTSNPLSLSII